LCGVGFWGVGFGGGGLAPNPQPPNPQSPIPNPQFKFLKNNNYIKIEKIIKLI